MTSHVEDLIAIETGRRLVDAREEITRLVDIIDRAPHGEGCKRLLSDEWACPCTCWKREALGGTK